MMPDEVVPLVLIVSMGPTIAAGIALAHVAGTPTAIQKRIARAGAPLRVVFVDTVILFLALCAFVTGSGGVVYAGLRALGALTAA